MKVKKKRWFYYFIFGFCACGQRGNSAVTTRRTILPFVLMTVAVNEAFVYKNMEI